MYFDSNDRDNWTPISALTTNELCGHAKRRSVVLLDNGRTARLVRWPGTTMTQDYGKRGRTEGKARVEFRPGAGVTVEREAVVAVFEPRP